MVETKQDEFSETVLATKLMPFTGKIAYRTIYLFLFSLIIYITSSLLGFQGFIPLWVTCIINTVCAYLLFTPLHEASHQNIKGKKRKLKWLENLIGWVSGLSLMAPFPMFRYLHIMHHGHTNHPEKDPDYWVASRNPIMMLLKCMTTYFAYYNHFRKDQKKLWTNVKTRKEYIVSTTTILFINVIIIWSGITFGWTFPLLIYVVPGYLALGFLAFAFDWLPHHPHDVQQRYLDTRIILKPGLNTILVSQNMHLIHHLYSGIPYYHYGDALKVLEAKLQKEGARIEK
ncbi:fatty acid desaturase [Ekhidna sp.]